MSEITAEKVKNLREISGAGMMDCKKALAENGGDMDTALDWLRKKGIAAAAKKSGRVAADGAVAVAVYDNKGVVVELNSETDFVAKNDKFQTITKEIVEAAKTVSTVDALKSAVLAGGKTVQDSITETVAIIGENINLRRMSKVEAKNGIVSSYVHNQIIPGIGKIGILVAMESTGNKEKLAALGKQIAMHIAAARPDALNIADVDGAAVEREKAIFSEQAAASGKPAGVIEKMVEGRIRKYYEEVVLMEQLFVIDGKTKISEVLKQAEADIGAPVSISSFIRYNVGEGIEKDQADFAAEVASMAKVVNG